MAQIEQIQQRLDNIQAVEPMLHALRMIALGSWQAAQKQKTAVFRYNDRLLAMLPYLLPHLRQNHPKYGGFASKKTALIFVMGSELGLCGRFNTAVVTYANQLIAEKEAAGVTLTVQVSGSRAQRLFGKGKRSLVPHPISPISKLPTYQSIHRMTQSWLQKYETHEFDEILLVFNQYQGMGSYKPAVVPLLPIATLPTLQTRQWPDPIVETDAQALFAQIIQQWVTLTLYAHLLESLMSEYSARYQLMESASKNAENLISEFTTTLQTARRQLATKEMQTLATHSMF